MVVARPSGLFNSSVNIFRATNKALTDEQSFHRPTKKAFISDPAEENAHILAPSVIVCLF